MREHISKANNSLPGAAAAATNNNNNSTTEDNNSQFISGVVKLRI